MAFCRGIGNKNAYRRPQTQLTTAVSAQSKSAVSWPLSRRAASTCSRMSCEDAEAGVVEAHAHQPIPQFRNGIG